MMRKKKYLFLVLSLCILPAMAQHFKGVQELIARQFPSLSGKVIFQPLSAHSIHQDAFRLHTNAGKIIVEANSVSAAACALNYYLNYYCHQSISRNGNNLSSVIPIVEIPKPLLIQSPFRYRYALNYCTYNYSYAFYTWQDWEWELDWMALNGVNLMLAPLGTEVVWYDTLKELGMSQKDIQDFIPGPAYTAWWLMGNLEGWGGPLSYKLMQQSSHLQKKILRRLSELGISPVVQGFYGMVPHKLTQKFPQEKIIDQGDWGKFKRPSVLLPESPLFSRMAQSYYKSFRKHYGSNFKFLAGDLFHEGGKTDFIPVGQTAARIQKNMQQYFPGSIWVLQGWDNNPRKELLDSLDKSLVLVIDLTGEKASTWESTQGFYHTPWIWGNVNHFGGKTDMGGQLPVLLTEPHRAAGISPQLQGIGILPEGIHSNPIVHDFALKTAWTDTLPSIDSSLRHYILYRYGQWDENLYNAWTMLSQSVYGNLGLKGEGTFESVFCARPDTNITHVTTWGPTQMQYNPQELINALVILRKSAMHFKDSETYRYDLVDLSRQVLANYARTIYQKAIQAYTQKDPDLLHQYSREFMKLIALQDRLTGSDPHFLLGKWLEKAANFAHNPDDKQNCVRNARMLLSYWGPDVADTPVHDYANKEWSGMLKDYYAVRWELFFKRLESLLQGGSPPAIDYFAIEKKWAEAHNTYPVEPQTDYLTPVDSVLYYVNPRYKDPQANIEDRVGDLLHRMSLKEKIAQMRHIHFKHFNNGGQVDLEKLKASTLGLSYGCVEAFPYSSEQYLKAMYQIQKYMKTKTRLGIPVIPVMEGLHGVVQDGCTIFPQSIAQAATFNPPLIEQMAAQIAKEMKAIGAKQVLAPDLDIAREIRWGRVEETFGEDPWLIAQMGAAYVKGIQSEQLIPTLKHYVAHGTPTGGLNLASVKGGKHELLDLYLKPFENVIKWTQPLSVMNCYSSYDHEVVTSSPYLMHTLLRDSLRFKGYVYSDWGSIPMLMYFHKVAQNPQEAALQAINAGIDLEAGSNFYQYAGELVDLKKLDEKLIDRATSHILYSKFASGLFDEPLPDTCAWKQQIHTTDAQRVAKRIADESIVLLENKNKLLPLSAHQFSSIAVIGPNADKVQFGDYSWTNSLSQGISPLEGIRQQFKGTIRYAPGCDLYSRDSSMLQQAIQAARKSDLSIVVVGTQSALLARPSPPATSGEGYDLAGLQLPGLQEQLLESIAALHKPFIVVLVTGRPFALGNWTHRADGLLVQWYGGEEGGKALAEILFGQINPSGRLPISFPNADGVSPSYYNYLPTDKGYYNKKGSSVKPGRDYVFSSPYAAYPFGYGLSYTHFKYEDLQLSAHTVRPNDTLIIRFRLTNDGPYAGSEVPQLYIRDRVSSILTPIKQLIDFQKINLQPQQSQRVTFKLAIDRLAIHNRNYQRVVEPGEFDLQLGNSSDHILLTNNFIVSNQHRTAPSLSRTSPTPLALGEAVRIRGTIRNVQASVMPGVKISALHSHTATASDAQGYYEIQTHIHDQLIFQLDGYNTFTLQISAGGINDIELTPYIP